MGIIAGFSACTEPIVIIEASIIFFLTAVLALWRKSAIVLHASLCALILMAAMTYSALCLDERIGFSSKFKPDDEVMLIGDVTTDPDQWPTKSRRYVSRQFKYNVQQILSSDPKLMPYDRSVISLANPALPEERPIVSKVNGVIDVRWHGSPYSKMPAYGEKWQFQGKVMKDKYGNSPNRNGFYLDVDMKRSLCISSDEGSPLLQMCYKSREVCRHYLKAGIPDFPVESGLLQAIVLGYRSTMPRDVKQTFVLSGTFHVFAISGSHIVVFAGLVIGVINMLGVRKKHWILVMGPLLIAYTAATGMQPSAVRACVMAVVVGLAPLLGRKPDVLSALAFSAVLILLFDPRQVFDIGCALSYGVVAGLIIVYPMFDRLIENYVKKDPLAIQHSESGREEIFRSILTAFLKLVGVSFAAWLVSTPLTIYYFGIFSPVSLLANLAVVPLSFLVILCGCLSLIFGPFITVIAEIFNTASVAILWIMVKLSELLTNLPYAYIRVEQGNALFPVLLLAVLFIASIIIRNRSRSTDISL